MLHRLSKKNLYASRSKQTRMFSFFARIKWREERIHCDQCEMNTKQQQQHRHHHPSTESNNEFLSCVSHGQEPDIYRTNEWNKRKYATQNNKNGRQTQRRNERTKWNDENKNAKGREGERKKNPTKHKMETGCSVTTFII